MDDQAAVNLGPIVGMDLNLWLTVYIAVIVWYGRKMKQTKRKLNNVNCDFFVWALIGVCIEHVCPIVYFYCPIN